MLNTEQIEKIKAIKDPLLRKRYAYLWRHPQIKELFFSIESANAILEISKKYHLPVEKTKCLAKTTGLVLLSEIPLSKFEQEIQQACGFIPDTAAMIAKEIDQMIFSKVKQFLDVAEEHNKIRQEFAEHGIEIKKPNNEAVFSSTIH